MIPLRDSQPSYSTPVVTAGIIAANVLVFLYQISLDSFSANYLVHLYGIVPARFEPSTLFTSMFLHGGWLHLIGNMWFLWIYGDNVEDILGGARYLVFYLLCGAAAGLAHVVTNPGSPVPTIGASGAVSGVMGAYLLKFPHSRIVTLIPVFFFLTTAEIPAVVILIYWFLIQVFSGMAAVGQMASAQGGVAWFAHVGGFLAGMVLISSMRTRERYRRRGDLRW
jgi:membrane associated rhomboid family serine protease